MSDNIQVPSNGAENRLAVDVFYKKQATLLVIRWGLGQAWRQQLHTDWVCQLQYISELNSILSCSLDKRLCLADVEARVTVKYLEGHTQGVRAVHWSKAYSFIASGGLDRNVMLWNPFQLQSMATLQVSSSNDGDNLLHCYVQVAIAKLMTCHGPVQFLYGSVLLRRRFTAEDLSFC